MSTLAAPQSAFPRVLDRARAHRALELLGVLVQLGLALLVVREFQLESKTFYRIAQLAAAGFVVHAVLPLRFRLPFFVGLSAAGLGLALGVVDAVIVAVVVALFVGICQLPLALRWRVALLLGAGALLAAARAGLLPEDVTRSVLPVLPSAWPVLGSILMFRLALYVHALATEEQRPTRLQAAAYFLMLPNVCFPLFPVVDFSTFRRTYYDEDALAIYRTGARWLARGLVQLLLYRYVYYHVVRDPAEVRTLGDLVTFLLATFALYLRVSGQFHLIVGMLHLFGFRLPETHKMYFLSSGFTDFWRRINIYWKDYMMKLVYYPSFFRLRRFGPRAALGGATAIVFVATWLLHSYQWFWLRGGFPLTWPDTLFWGILGALVLWTALREARRGRDRSLGARRWSWRLAARTVGTFWVICVLWSLWSAESVTTWLQLWDAAAVVDARGLALLGVVVGAHVAVAGRNWTAPVLAAGRMPWWRAPGVATTALLAAVLLLGRTEAYERLAPRAAGVVASLQKSTLNQRDQALRHKGYYEKLDNVNRFTTELWDVLSAVPADMIPLPQTAAWRHRADLLAGDIKPSVSMTFFRKPLTTNSFGMRDREYAVAKPAGTWRAALLGPSFVMGMGVGDGDLFESLVEARLNRELRGRPHERYEVLNFAVPAFSLLQQELILAERAAQFRPDVVIATLYPRVNGMAANHLQTVLSRGIPITDDTVRAILERAGLTGSRLTGLPVHGAPLRAVLRAVGIQTRVPWREERSLLAQHAPAINAYAIRQLARDSRAVGAVPVLLVIDQVETDAEEDPYVAPLREEARRAGFLVLDLLDVYEGRDPTTLRIADWDHHPNEAGHAVIADRLFADLLRHRDALRLAAPRP